MAWIRRVRTASGATAVQIAESVGGRRRIVAHVGSARTEAELGLLLSRARELLADPGQGEFELGIEPVAPRATLVGPAGDAALLDADGSPERGPAAVAAPRVVSTASRVLYDVLASVFTALGFDAVGDRVFRDLVIARIVEPTSIRDTGRVLTDLGCKPASEKTMRRTLTRAHTGAYRDQIAQLCFAHAMSSGDVSLCLYDVTTLYFEADKEDDLRKVGYSKERRVDPQIVVGLLVDRHGFPLEIGCFAGNKAETLTLLPVIRQFQARHQITGMVIVADAGMLSATNLRELDEAGLGFIVGSRTTKAPIDLESHYRWHGDYFTDGQIIDTITPRTGTNRDNDPALKAEPVWNPRTHTSSWRAVWAYSATRAVRDNKTLNAQEAKARAVIAGEKTTRTPRFVTINGNTRTLDEASLARARKLVGLKGYVTNIGHHVMSPSNVISNYHDLWHVEQSFRMSKTDLAARPMFHHTKDAIEAHLTIVFTALAVTREVQNRTGLAIRNVLRQLRPLRSATLAINNATQTFPPQIDPDQQAIINALTPSGPQALTK
ncbi:IS1634 family transposase [Micromonospora sp. WMMD1082]|uniref:IS1634 family transposase n=1 Tax=Micromonospora sp. WMMD1082 TaxID=3016104 RepID=UPI002416D21F|nr:IS1634 family transposase [Micromonospora sp. WMMD1082]MDG4793337.1 IS1634 family transposase [Micromonospora sp. WMMD1082]MDG4793503.1 IS1634 family transposase [Micromonospora sp. WMMD1082]MDG4794456.1 IS1634 family transposase [Micromonospora sp. WMMD1082]MDG4795464.1 IS1634 family transposase [Micromonospora sp. WMMD1082]MDG4797002.1 IS1634 family transposase [Micromonospora sp. WMMD1082]